MTCRRPGSCLPWIAAAAGVAVACCPTTPAGPSMSPAERHRAALLREGNLFVQVRVDRVRTLAPLLGEAIRLTAASISPGAACLADLAWSADIITATLDTAGAFGAAQRGGALVEGPGIPASRVEGWADCFLAGLGSGRTERTIPAGAAVGDGEGSEEPHAGVHYFAGTGEAADVGVGTAAPGRHVVAIGEPLDQWAAALVDRGSATGVPERAAALAERVDDADIAIVWTDSAAVAAMLAAMSGGLATVPPAEEIRGLAAGLWLGEGAQARAVLAARGPEAAAALAECARTVVTVMHLFASVIAAQFGRRYGADVQERTERVGEIAARVDVRVAGDVALARVDLSADDLDGIQSLLLTLASDRLEAP